MLCLVAVLQMCLVSCCRCVLCLVTDVPYVLLQMCLMSFLQICLVPVRVTGSFDESACSNWSKLPVSVKISFSPSFFSPPPLPASLAPPPAVLVKTTFWVRIRTVSWTKKGIKPMLASCPVSEHHRTLGNIMSLPLQNILSWCFVRPLVRDCEALCTPVRAYEPLCTPVRTYETLCTPVRAYKSLCTPVRVYETLCTPFHSPEANWSTKRRSAAYAPQFADG